MCVDNGAASYRWEHIGNACVSSEYSLPHGGWRLGGGCFKGGGLLEWGLSVLIIGRMFRNYGEWLSMSAGGKWVLCVASGRTIGSSYERTLSCRACTRRAHGD